MSTSRAPLPRRRLPEIRACRAIELEHLRFDQDAWLRFLSENWRGFASNPGRQWLIPD